jgi:hypothetical protein
VLWCGPRLKTTMVGCGDAASAEEGAAMHDNVDVLDGGMMLDT